MGILLVLNVICQDKYKANQSQLQDFGLKIQEFIRADIV